MGRRCTRQTLQSGASEPPDFNRTCTGSIPYGNPVSHLSTAFPKGEISYSDHLPLMQSASYHFRTPQHVFSPPSRHPCSLEMTLKKFAAIHTRVWMYTHALWHRCAQHVDMQTRRDSYNYIIEALESPAFSCNSLLQRRPAKPTLFLWSPSEKTFW